MIRNLKIAILAFAAALLLAGCDKPGKEEEVEITVSEFSDATEAAAEFGGGTGAKSDPYIISSAEELKRLVNELPANTVGTYYKLTTDIHITTTEWTPIGGIQSDGYSSTYDFGGHFDGNGHTITGMLVSTSPQKNNWAFGFFGVVNGSVSNLIIYARVINSAFVNESDMSRLYVYTGAIAGFVKGSLINCTSRGRVVDNTAGFTCFNVGGIAGVVIGEDHGGTFDVISHCSNYANVLGSCNYIYGDISRSYTGGIVGSAGLQVEIVHCENHGDVTGSCLEGMGSCNTGGVVGGSNHLFVWDCVNSGDILGGLGRSSATGGVCGYGATIHHSFNSGDVYSFYSDTPRLIDIFTGGLCGASPNIGSCCVNTGKVDGAAPGDDNAVGDMWYIRECDWSDCNKTK